MTSNFPSFVVNYIPINLAYNRLRQASYFMQQVVEASAK